MNSSIKGVVLAEYDTHFTDPYYGSRFDNSSNVQTEAIAAAAAALAAGLFDLIGGDPAQLKVSFLGITYINWTQ
jgi:hypothetical protein